MRRKRRGSAATQQDIEKMIRSLTIFCVMIFWLCVFPFVFSPWKRRKPFRLTKARYPPKRLACGRGWWMRRVVWRRALWSFKALIGTCDAGLKPPPNGGTGPNLIRPGTCFSDFRYRFKSVLRNSGRICLANRSQGYVTGIPHPPPKRPAFNFKYVRLAVSVPRLGKGGSMLRIEF